jgi:3-hydroxyisobutyrate dehydrogenase-like beta-hydroxyacid dehydrogenase
MDTIQLCDPIVIESGSKPTESSSVVAARESALALRVGVVGLGRMGFALAANLCKDGFEVQVFDRNAERMEALRNSGASPTSKIADLASCRIVLSSLPDDEALGAVAFSPAGLLDSLEPRAIHISMSTVSPGLSKRLAEGHARRDQYFIAAPVLGNPDLAARRDLFIIAAGPAIAVEIARPLLERLGQRLFVIGHEASAASLMKLGANVLTASVLQSMGEVLALFRKSGIDPMAAFNVLTNSLFDGRVHKTYGGKIVTERYRPAGMTLPLAAKDIGLALEAAGKSLVPMPMAAMIHERLLTAIGHGWGDLDWSALGLLASREAGLNDAADCAAPARSTGK